MISLVERVARFAGAERLFRRGDSVMAAVSGGADSLACLLILVELRERFGFSLQAVHFDHQLRDDSRDGLEFVREFCESRGIDCLTGEGDVRALARQQRIGIEEAARQMRYQFLGFVAAQKRVGAVVTGHTADDQAETVLMRVLRGTGVRGLRGMLPASPLPGAPAQRLLRPLLCLSREETLAVCAAADVTPLIDPSNADTAILRNRLRNETIPTLAAINPSVKDALRGLAASARELFADVERSSLGVQPVARTPVGAVFARAPLGSLQAEALTLLIEREASFFGQKPEVNRTRVHDLQRVLRSGTGLVLFGPIAVEASSGKVRVGPPLAPEAFAPRVLDVPGATLVAPWRVEVAVRPFAEVPGASLATFDGSALRGALRARPAEPGDRMLYHGIERKVADVFANAKLPAWERTGALAIADGERVRVLFTAGGVFEEDVAADGDAWFVRVTAAPE
ncbi:MAG: tRNA lysidine(34) synthetase TilS [Dehalococcoidia bacterium]